jgi:predicted transglutaminase-like cysteine proteinase
MEVVLGSRLHLLVASIALVLSTSFASAQSSSGSAMMVGGTTSQPIGHYEFCQSHRAECRRMTPASPMVLTATAWQQLNAVNAKVNAAVYGLTDLQIYGREEVWAYPTNAGDCEDYVLAKRQMLIAAGWDPSDLLITMVLRTSGDGHAVLTARTDHGDYILDNLNAEVELWTDTPYLFVKRQSQRDAGEWVSILGGTNLAAMQPATQPFAAAPTGLAQFGQIGGGAGNAVTTGGLGNIGG